MKFKKIISNFWYDNYFDNGTNACMLCGNTGIIQTNEVKTPAGIPLKNRKIYCLCSNGRAIKEIK